MENTELDTTILKRMKRIFKTDEDAFNFFLENVELDFRCRLCRRPQVKTSFRFRCCGGNQNVFHEHRFVFDAKKNRINRMPFTKALAAFLFCYELYLVFGEKFTEKITFDVFHVFVGNFYRTTFHFKKNKFRKLGFSDFKKYNKLFEKLVEKLNNKEYE